MFGSFEKFLSLFLLCITLWENRVHQQPIKKQTVFNMLTVWFDEVESVLLIQYQIIAGQSRPNNYHHEQALGDSGAF